VTFFILPQFKTLVNTDQVQDQIQNLGARQIDERS
jgi:hypothetical protein